MAISVHVDSGKVSDACREKGGVPTVVGLVGIRVGRAVGATLGTCRAGGPPWDSDRW